MKRTFLIMISIALMTTILTSCLNTDDDGYSLGKFWVEIVTVVPQDNGVYYFRTDAGETLWPGANNTNYRPDGQTRVLLNYTILGENPSGSFDYIIKVNQIANRLTKSIAEDRGIDNDSIYGTAPVEIQRLSNGKDYMWVGDGYLNIYFEAYFGGTRKHYINLINTNPENPYELEFRHNEYDDPRTRREVSFVAFDLSTLPKAEADTIPLIIKVNSFSGEKIYTHLKYIPNQKEKVSTEALYGLVTEEVQ